MNVKIWMNRAPADEGGGEGAPAETPPAQPSEPTLQPPPPPFEQMLGEAQVSDELKEYGKKLGGLDKLLNHAYNQESLIGRKGVLVPGKTHEEDPEGWNQFYSELGRPDEPAKYEMPELPDGVEVDESFAQWAKETAHKWGLNQRQLAGFMSDYVALGESRKSEVMKGGEEAQAQARERLNATYAGRADEVLSDVKAMYERYGGPEAVKAMEAAGLDLDLNFVKGAYQMSRRMKESGLFGSIQPGGGQVVSKEQAQARIKEIQGTPSLRKAMTDRNDPGHADLKREFDQMMQVVYPPDQEGAGPAQPDGSLVFKVGAS